MNQHLETTSNASVARVCHSRSACTYDIRKVQLSVPALNMLSTFCKVLDILTKAKKDLVSIGEGPDRVPQRGEHPQSNQMPGSFSCLDCLRTQT